MSCSALFKTLLLIGVALAVLPYLYGRMQAPTQAHPRGRTALQLNLEWVRWQLKKVSLVQSDDC